jgi:hypothetical protein
MILPERFELDREIGRGGMAVVYRPQDRHLGRFVAINGGPGLDAIGPISLRLLVPERKHRVNARGTAGWNKTGHPRYAHENHRYDGGSRQVVGANAVE